MSAREIWEDKLAEINKLLAILDGFNMRGSIGDFHGEIYKYIHDANNYDSFGPTREYLREILLARFHDFTEHVIRYTGPLSYAPRGNKDNCAREFIQLHQRMKQYITCRN